MIRPILVALPLMLAPLAATADSFGPLVSPADLSRDLDRVQPILLDLRKEASGLTWLPGAISAPYVRFRGPDDNPGAVPPLAELEAFFEELGLDPEAPIVVIPEGQNDSDFGAAARVYWTLKSTGFTDLSILNGGEQAWRAAGFPTAAHPDALLPTELELHWLDDWTADTAAVTAVIEGREAATLIDARPAAFYTGRKAHEAAATPGTLPGAVNHAYTGFFSGGPTMTAQLDTATLRETLGLTGEAPAIAFCNTGHWAATEWFALSEVAGLPAVKLYPGSMVEYSQTGAPMQNRPGLVANALRQIFGG